MQDFKLPPGFHYRNCPNYFICWITSLRSNGVRYHSSKWKWCLLFLGLKLLDQS